MSMDPAPPPPPPTGPRRSLRERVKSAAAAVAEMSSRAAPKRRAGTGKRGPDDARAELEAELGGADDDRDAPTGDRVQSAAAAKERPPRKRKRVAKEKAAERRGAGAGAEVEAEMEVDANGADADRGAAPTGGRVQSAAAAKERPRKKRKRAAAKEKAEEEQRPAAADDDDVCAEEPDSEQMVMEEAEVEEEAQEAAKAGGGSAAEKAAARKRAALPSKERRADATEDHFVGEPVPDHEAKQRWPERYKAKGLDVLAKRCGEDEELKARCHYTAANVDDVIYHLDDDVYVKAGPNEENYIGRITEFFEGLDHGFYFTCQWFFRTTDTVISPKLLKVHDHRHDEKRVFLSEEKNDNMIECIVSKVKIIHLNPNISNKTQSIKDWDFYYDMSYSVAYSTFANLPADNDGVSSSEASSISDDVVDPSKETLASSFQASSDVHTKTASLLDLYSGCGAMSTGLCLGAALSNFNLETRWAVDMNAYACESLKYNHPRSKVRNEKAEDFLSLLKEWDALCKKYVVQKDTILESEIARSLTDDEDEDEPLSEDTYEVEKLLDICHGDPNSSGKVGLWFKVRWKGYDQSYDTWEPIDGLRDCPDCIEDFVQRGYRENILPLPGTVDVICGGPPCQGISGFNRFRSHEDPLKDEKNKQLVVFMDIVKYLKPKYVLMENVVDILKFADGFLGKYALSRLVATNYQARLGMMVAGCYGLPQFRMRVFIWGALPSMALPKFPLPTHDVVKRGVVPNAFEQSVVAYDETEAPRLRKALTLADAISDLPEVGNHQPEDVMDFIGGSKTEFQRFIRLNRKAMMDYSFDGEVDSGKCKLFDHQPLRLNNDDYERVLQIPLKKGANFRDLKGVKVGINNTVEWDPDVPRVFLPSGKPLVPDYAMSFIKGKSVKPFGRLWWDEIVPTVVTRAEPHNQIILHPGQARVLTIRENARLQGFPDYYRLFGPIKQKYMQVGNAVAVPVARALGYSLGMAYMGRLDGDGPLFKLPQSFTRTPVVFSGGEDADTEQVLDR